MLKSGKVIFDTCEYFIYWYTGNNLAERIDVVDDLAQYEFQDTSGCEASYISKNNFKAFGKINIVKALLKIKNKASMLNIPERKEVKVENGKFIITITKENPDTNIFYKTVMENGRIVSEIFKTEDGTIEIYDVQDVAYDGTEIMYNEDDYEIIDRTINVKHREEVKKVGNAQFYSYNELLRKYPAVSHVVEPPNDYVVVESYEQARERLNTWIESKIQLKAYDIESYHTEWGPTSDNRITGIFLGLGTTWSTYFPFRQDNFEHNLPLEFMAEIAHAINNQPPSPEVILLAHNVKFEHQGFYQEFREMLRCDVDTYILAVLVDPMIKKGSHTLKALTAKVDNHFYLTLEQIFIGPVQFNVLPPEIVKLYGCPDATSPAKLYPYLMNKLPKDEQFVMQLEMQLPEIKAEEEFYGIRMDQERLKKLIEDEEYKVNMLMSLFQKIHHTSRNINSNDVLSDILYNKLRCPVEVWTSKGKPATSKVAIDRIIDTGYKGVKDNDVIPQDILDRNGKVIIEGKKLASNRYPSLLIYQQYKSCTKELGALRRLESHSRDGFFKFYINQVGAGSNRQTSDAHQFSDTMKSCALADSPHHQLVSCDWKQVELRILAGLAHQEDLMKLEEDPDVDIHRAILSIIQGKPMYMISEEDRKKGKSVNFGVVYMMSEYGLARRDYGPAYTRENLDEERKKIMDFFNGLPRIKNLLKSNEEFLKHNGYIKTAFNYYRYFPELLDPTTDPKLISRMVRSGNNTPVQGTGAQMLKIVETSVRKYIKDKGWDKEQDYDGKMLPKVRMILPIHDEILLSYDKSIPMEEIITMFKECMELDIKGMPPFFAAPAFINNWYDGKNPVYEVDIPFRDKIVEEYKKGNYLLAGKDYVQVLMDYRNGEIREYMEDLISKYKTVDEVAKHVTHDALTHTLIETLIPDKGERKKLSHTERIHEAVRRYVEQLKNNGTLDLVINKEAEKDESGTDFIPIDEWATNYTHIDANGDLIIEEVDEYETEDVDNVEELLPIEDRKVDAVRVLYLMNECLIDLTNMDFNTTAEIVNQRVQKLCSDSSYYHVVYVIGNKTLRTSFKIGYIPNELEALINEVMSEVKI